MTDIFCSAEHCVHNKNCACCLESVHVGGCNAESCDGTDCENFTEGTPSMSMPAAKSPCHRACIDCDADNCRFNRDGECDAESIDICGENACDCGGTKCSSFRK